MKCVPHELCDSCHIKVRSFLRIEAEILRTTLEASELALSVLFSRMWTGEGVPKVAL